MFPDADQDPQTLRSMTVDGQQNERERETEAGNDDELAPSKSEMEHLAVRLMALECLVSE